MFMILGPVTRAFILANLVKKMSTKHVVVVSATVPSVALDVIDIVFRSVEHGTCYSVDDINPALA